MSSDRGREIVGSSDRAVITAKDLSRLALPTIGAMTELLAACNSVNAATPAENRPQNNQENPATQPGQNQNPSQPETQITVPPTPAPEESPTPFAMDSSAQSEIGGLYFGSYTNPDGNKTIIEAVDGGIFEINNPGYQMAVLASGAKETPYNDLYRQENPQLPAGFKVDGSYFDAQSTKGGTVGKTPQGIEVKLIDNLWVDPEGKVFNPYVVNKEGSLFGFPALFVDSKDKKQPPTLLFGLVDNDGKLISKPRPAFLTPTEEAKLHGFSGEASKIGITKEGIVKVTEKDTNTIKFLSFFREPANTELAAPDVALVEQAVNPFANAFGLDEAKKTQVMAEIIKPENIRTLTGADGQTFKVAVTNDGYPLMIATQNQETGMWSGWKKVTLKKLFEENKINNGTEFTGWWLDNTKWQQIVSEQFNLATIDYGIYWKEIEPEQGQFNYSIAEEQIKLAKKNNMDIRGMGLVCQTLYPDWLKNHNGSPDDFKEILKNHVYSIVSHFKGNVNEWTVVTEPYINPYRTNDVLYKKLGYDYIEIAFQAARTADPDALLIYEDTFNHTSNGITTSLTHKIVDNLKTKGLIDRVGLEMHIDASQPLNSEDIIKTMKSYGVPVSITSVDVDMSKVGGNQQEKLVRQAKIYQELVKICLDSDVCVDFSVWGIGDKYHWLDQQNPNANPTLFDDNLEPKPALWGMMKTLIDNLNS
ncbi:endo-1,4-beta-xylanase [Candidatus Roizmanbacteria bacterium]|jgi:endo-1,4-beta-xylanase|nr:endo-1,4-beta-xylanase [Candidatus Roizmanbacteria bacterium]